VRCQILHGSSGGGPCIRAGVQGRSQGRWRNSRGGDGNLMAWPLELELLHGVKEEGRKMGEHMAGEVMRKLLVVRDRWKAVQNGGERRWPLVAAASDA
jgi:hypothetical protein